MTNQQILEIRDEQRIREALPDKTKMLDILHKIKAGILLNCEEAQAMRIMTKLNILLNKA